MSKDVSDLIAEWQVPFEEVTICSRADLVAEHERLDAELEQLLDSPPQRFNGDPRRTELAQRIVALEARMAESTIVFRLQPMPKRKWHRMVAEHPPRILKAGDDFDIHPQDKRGVNSVTFHRPLIAESTVSPVLTEEQWLDLVGHSEVEAERLEAEGRADEIRAGKLTPRQHEMLNNAAWQLNRDPVAAPFSSAASRLIPTSAPE